MLLSLADLIVPGEGPVAQVLASACGLCQRMHEAQAACAHLHRRLLNLLQELQRMHEEGHLPARGPLSEFVEIIAAFVKFLRKYHSKALVFRVANFQQMTTELHRINERVEKVFEALDVGAPVHWNEQWEEDRRVQVAILGASVEDYEAFCRGLQSPRAVAEAFLTLKFELEKRAARNTVESKNWIKCSMENLLGQIKTHAMKLPSWFLPLSEMDFESKPFAVGHFGAVHRGWLDCGEPVVVKFFAVDEVALDERVQLRIEKELSELHHLDHPNVAKLFGASHVNCPPYVVSEDTSDGNLAAFLARSTDNNEKMWRMLYEAALGLQYLHKKGVVHGHLKLNNILSADGEVKLSDFGLNTLRACSGRAKGYAGGTQSSMLRWCAPECLERRPTFASDLYSLAMCIVEAVNGEPPFEFLDDNSVRDSKRRGTIQQPEEMEDDAWDLVVAMTNADPASRIELKEVLSTLKSFADKDAARRLRSVSLSACRSCDSETMADSRFCSQCGTPMRPSTEPSANVPLLEANSSGMSVDTPVSNLVTVIQSGSVDEQEQALVFLLQKSIANEQPGSNCDVRGMTALIDVVKHGRTHFIQVCALKCVSLIWAKASGSGVDAARFQELKGTVPALTSPELDAIASALTGDHNNDKLKALIHCACTAAVSSSQKLHDAELVKPMVELLRTGDESQAIWAANAVGHLANNAENCTAVAQDGAVPPLMTLLRSGTRVQKEQSAWALARLTAFNPSAANEGVVPLAMSLLRDGSGAQKLHATSTLANLTSHTHEIVSGGGIALLVALLRVGVENQKAEAARALASIALTPEHRNRLVAEEAVAPLVALLRGGTGMLKTRAAAALAYLTYQEANRDKLVQEGVMLLFVELLRCGTSDQKGPAVLALANLTVEVSNREVIGQAGAILSLIVCLRDGRATEIENAACALGNLALNDKDRRDAIAGHGAISPLVRLLGVGTSNQKNHAMRALANLAMNAGNCKKIADAGAIVRMVAILQSGNEKQKAQATRGFVYLAGNAQTRSATGMSSAIRPVVKLLQSGNEATKANSALILGNLAAANDANRDNINRTGAVSWLEELRRNGTSAQKRNAAVALVNIVQDDEVEPKVKRSRLS